MPKNLVNLDALIKREDFEVRGDAPPPPSELRPAVDVAQLEPGSLFHQVLRKPDFQRETSDWDPEKIAELVQSFLNGDLIPSVILWRSPLSQNIFVIDGAHRLSAFIGWVCVDYGSGSISIPFFENFIPPEQIKAAEKTRELIQQYVGTYRELKTALQGPAEFVKEERLTLAKNLSAFAINLQWVPGDARRAESSFFKINQKAVVIDDTELVMIQARRKPNAVATRALIRAGTGHKYWSAFSEDIQDEIESIARNVYEILFKPAMETPIKSLDQPIAGRGYSADSVRMIFELVNFINDVPDTTKEDSLPDDTDGDATLRYLRAVKRAATLISGNEPQSVGLHPFVYFYGATGRFQPTAFLASIAFIQELAARRGLPRFTEHRDAFEEFLLRYRHFTNQIARRFGSLQRGLAPTITMYRRLLVGIAAGKNDDEIIEQFHEEPQLQHLRPITEEDRRYGRDFSRDTKNAALIRDAMEQELRCRICNARLHFKSISIDHKERRAEGGRGSPDNAQLTHPYCNSGYKEQLAARKKG
jgi:hypothetical protein